MDFFSTAAQVGGVLVIALMFELRLFVYRERPAAVTPELMMPAAVGLSLLVIPSIVLPMAAIAADANTSALRAGTAVSLIIAMFAVLAGGVVSWTSSALQHPNLIDDAEKKLKIEHGWKPPSISWRSQRL